VIRVVLLPAGNRVSVLLELGNDVTRAVRLPGTDDRAFEVEIGPLQRPVVAENLSAAPTSPIVSEVSVRGDSNDGATVARVLVKGRRPMSGSVRVSGRRVYLDFAPRLGVAGTPPVEVAKAPAPASSSSLPSRQPAGSGPRPGRSGSEALVQPTGSEPRTALSDDEVLAQAQALAQRPDVKGLERLVTDLLRRSGRAADRAAEDPLVSQLSRYLEQARQLQLTIDAQLLRQEQENRYRVAILPVLAELDRNSAALAAWADGSRLSPAIPELIRRLDARVRTVEPPSEMASAHGRLLAALDAAVRAMSGTGGGDEAGFVGPLAAIDEAKAALRAQITNSTTFKR
jgi:hypothetical protein